MKTLSAQVNTTHEANTVCHEMKFTTFIADSSMYSHCNITRTMIVGIIISENVDNYGRPLNGIELVEFYFVTNCRR